MELISDANTTIETLTLQLVDFGLNPGDWSLTLRSQGWAEVSHVADENFKFIGQINQLKKTWQSLELAGI